jgi:hypothetical protein
MNVAFDFESLGPCSVQPLTVIMPHKQTALAFRSTFFTQSEGGSYLVAGRERSPTIPLELGILARDLRCKPSGEQESCGKENFILHN